MSSIDQRVAPRVLNRDDSDEEEEDIDIGRDLDRWLRWVTKNLQGLTMGIPHTRLSEAPKEMK